MKSSFFTAATFCAALITTPVFANDANTVLAKVGDTEITLGHVIALVDRLPEQFKSIGDKELFEGVLDQMVQQTLLASEIDEDSTAVKIGKDNEIRAMLATLSIEAIAEKAVGGDAVGKAYEEYVAEFEAAREWNASHILVETEEEANALVTELEGGADFAELAKEKSTGPSGPNGGSLGWFGAGQMVPPFEAAVAELEVGAVSAPVQTQFGWHVVKLNEQRDTQPPALSEMAEELGNELRNKAIEAEIARLEEATSVTKTTDGIDPALIRDKSLLD